MNEVVITEPQVDELIEKVRYLSKEYPDAIYVRPGRFCSYSSGEVVDGPEDCGCIMGQAARLLDDSNPLKQKVANDEFNSLTAITNLIRKYDPKYNLPRAKLQWLSLVQHTQDTRSSWSNAVAYADKNE